ERSGEGPPSLACASFGATAFGLAGSGSPSRSVLACHAREGWRKRLRVELSPPAQRGKQPILKTGRATGPRSLPFLSEGLRPSDSPTRSLARRFAGALRSRGALASLVRQIIPPGPVGMRAASD